MQHTIEASSIFSRDFPAVNVFRESLDVLDRVFDFCPDCRCRRKRRVPQPIMTNHSFFCGISDCSRLELSHRRKRLLDLRPHLIEHVFRKFHSADVERKTEFTVFQKIPLKPLPQ